MSIMMNIIDNINQEQIKEIPEFSAGDDGCSSKSERKTSS